MPKIEWNEVIGAEVEVLEKCFLNNEAVAWAADDSLWIPGEYRRL